MKQEQKELLAKYITCFSIASLIAVIVFWINGFFTDNIGVNIQILSDGFFVSGAILTMFAGFLFIGDEGGLLGISYILRCVVQAFVPMGRKNHELYRDYRERKLSEKKAKKRDNAILVTGLVFLSVGIIFTVIWYTNFYNAPN